MARFARETRRYRVSVTDASGATVKVFPSSGAEVHGPKGVTRGPFVWLDVAHPADNAVSAHLTVGQARRIRDALSEFIAQASRRASRPTPSAAAARPHEEGEGPG